MTAVCARLWTSSGCCPMLQRRTGEVLFVGPKLPPLDGGTTMRFLPAAAILALSAAALSGGSAPVSAQRYVPIGGEAPSLLIEVTKPFVSADGPFAGASFATSAWDASVAYPLGSGPTLFARMGLLYASIEGLDGSLALTNPRVGVLIGSATGNRRAELHVDVPLATDFGE